MDFGDSTTFGTAEEVIAGLDAINAHNAALSGATPPAGLSALRSEMCRALGAHTGLSFNQAMQGLNAVWPFIAQREATLRKDVFEGAAQIADKYADGITSPFCAEKVTVADCMISAAQIIAEEIRKEALNAAPAPAGAAKGDSK